MNSMRKWMDLVTESLESLNASFKELSEIGGLFDLDIGDLVDDHYFGINKDGRYFKGFVYALYLFARSKFRLLDQNEQKRIYSAFGYQHPKLKKDYVLWRGINLESWDELAAESDFRNSDTVVFDALLSTSQKKEPAMEFMAHSGNGGEIRILFKIHARAGTRGIDLEIFKGSDIYHPGEYEVVLDGRFMMKFRVIKRALRNSKYYGNYWFVEMEQVPYNTGSG